MKFRFNGDADCPDWILAEIYTLSRLSSVKLKSLAQLVIQGILTPPIQIEKVEKLFTESKLDVELDLKSSIACLNYILSASVRYGCNSSALQSELQQLGLPREHSNSIKRVYDEHSATLAENFKMQSLKVNNLESISVETDPEVGCVLTLGINGEKVTATLPESTLDGLLADLKHVRGIMAELKASG
ncbi:COMM domain-containing protein 4 [Anthonomus grandis grandis]|uniref:COMM domain-containing protein 4 n=1 Tax=Anthonomus grandis grandis TaxID=2921223 RepID=UPI0021663A25|nr:COMM domain-containing protein 4 [Anthonomus grandis grandis]